MPDVKGTKFLVQSGGKITKLAWKLRTISPKAYSIFLGGKIASIIIAIIFKDDKKMMLKV